MGYGGKQAIRSGDIRRFNFTGNGSNTAFDLGFTPATQNQLIVTVNGLVQHYDAFSVTGSTLTFTGTPASGDTIQVTAVVDAVGVAAIPDGAIANVSSLAVSGAATLSNTVAITGNLNTLSKLAVGTASPSQRIHAYDGSGGSDNVVLAESSAGQKILIQADAGANTGKVGTLSNHPLTLVANNTEYARLSTAGILTTASQLIANGSIKNIESANPTIWSSNSASLTDGSMYMQLNTTSSEGRMGTYTSHPLVLMTGNGRQVIIDTTGRMTIPNQPGFKIGIGNRTSSYTPGSSICTDNGFTINTDRDCFNRGAYYNATNGRFTAPVAGVYIFAYSIMRNGNSTGGGSNLDIRLVKNNGGAGSMYGRTYVGSYTSDYEAHAATTFIQLSAGDWVTLNLWSGNLYFDDSWFSGHLMA